MRKTRFFAAGLAALLTAGVLVSAALACGHHGRSTDLAGRFPARSVLRRAVNLRGVTSITGSPTADTATQAASATVTAMPSAR